MKKIALFTSILFFAFSLSTVKAQILDSVIVTAPIVCFGDLATATAYMTQTIPGTDVQLLNYRLGGGLYWPSGYTGIIVSAQQPFSGLIPATYRMFMVDSLAWEVAFASNIPPGPTNADLVNATDPSIFGYVDYIIDGIPPLIATATQTAVNECYGDCDAAEKLAITGGTPPYSITINTITSVLGLSSVDTTYLNLCADTYDATIVDVNGCPTAGSGITSFFIDEPTKLIPDGDVLSDYNSRDISCFGAADGSILAAVTGGSPTYEYSIDDGTGPGPFSTNPIFTGLIAGSYTITYRDANFCDTTEIITLNDPPDLSGALNITQQVSCFGANDGEIEFIVNSINTGTPGYMYSLDGAPFQGAAIFSGLAGGFTYQIIVKDVNDCEYPATIFLAEPTELVFDTVSLNYNGFGVSCNGSSDGQITIFGVSGGVPTYEYSIDGGATFTSQTIYPGLSAGTYTVQVRDATGCIEEKIMIITEPGVFTIIAAVTSNYNGSDVSCYGVCDGEVTVTPTNGVGSITYNMVPFTSQTSNQWFNVCGDLLYTINAADENGCSATDDIILTEPSPWVYTVDSTEETCGLANGEASINITQGGTGIINYLWDDPAPQQITDVATNLETGMYTVTVTDANGCGFSEDVFVGEKDIILDFDSVPPCNAGNDGEATVFPNGIPPYVIVWLATGETTAQITGLSPGFYLVTVTDDGGAGCSVTDSVEIPAVSLVVLALDMTIPQDTLVTCWNDPSSGITVIATGGTGINTYTYYIPGIFPIPQASPTFFGLFAGTYTIFVEDFNGCTDSIDVTIIQPDSLIFTTSSQDVGCNGDSTGMAYIDTIYGGTAPYTYLWDNGSTNDTIFNLIAGTYTLTATDSLGCLMIPPSSIITINEPFALQSAITVVSDATCDSSQTLATGEMSVSASGGTPGITGYSYLWNTTSTSTSINFLMPGMYTVEITDSNGCTVLDSAEILTGENPTLDSIQIQHVSCYDSTNGWMFVQASGGQTPYSFTADGGVTFVPSGTPFGPTGEASYFITVVDNLGCTDADSVHVTRPELVNISSLIQNVSCYDSADGELTAIVTGGTPGYSYVWIDATTDTVATTQIVDSLVLGSYIVIVTDTNSCIATSDSMKITQPDSLYISELTSTAVLCNGGNTGTATVVAAGGTPNYSYFWSTGDTTAIDSNLTQGNYLIQISDSHGCSRKDSIDVTEPDVLTTIFDMDSVSCNGGNDGSGIVLVSGGVPPYTYLWDNGSIADSAYNLAAGYHTVAITDFNLCVLIDSVEILDPVLLTIDNLIIEEITCYNANDGIIQVQATGGNPPYMYSTDNGSFTQSWLAFSNLSPNTYIMYVEDNKGCVDRDTVTLINPDSLYIDTTIFSHVQCYGATGLTAGSIQAINAIGGTAPYEYSVNGGAHHANMAYFWGYSPGTYTVEVFDAHNCVAGDIIIITEPSELDVTITTSNWYFNTYQIQCNGDTSGFADITVNGGVGSYTYTVGILDINNVLADTVVSSANSHISGLEAGALTFVIMDSNGCTYEETIIYNEPLPIIHNFIATHISCSGWSNGSLIDVVSGGVGTATSYSYAWNTGDSTYSLSSLPQGIYTDTVEDVIGCISIDSYTISEVNVLTLTVTNSVDVSCHDYCDGVIEVAASGGMPNINPSGAPVYSYQWDDILLQTNSAAIGLCVDNTSNSSTFTCTVTDAQGCTVTATQDIEQEEELIITADILNAIACNTGNDGKLTADITGGNGGTTYLWNNWTTWDTNPVNNNLSVGSYVVVVKDANDCMDTTEIYLPEPSALSITVDTSLITNVSCFGFGDGTITAAVSGGTPFFPNFEYDYTWSNSFSEQINISTATDLIPGIYTVIAEDANGCTIPSQSVSITGPADPLIISVDSTDAKCDVDDGDATAFVLGGTLPYTYAWSNGGTTNPLYNLGPGLYTVNVTDANGCTIPDETGAHRNWTFVNGRDNIFMPGYFSSIDSTICLGESIFLDIQERMNSINEDMTYEWEDGSIIADRWVTPTADTNVYTLTIFAGQNCLGYTVTATIYLTPPVDPLVSTNPSSETPGLPVHILPGESIEILSNNMACDIYKWYWRADPNSDSIPLPWQRVITEYPVETGRYYIEVDSAGCEGSDSIAVAVGVKPYDAITPNEDGFNDVWKIPGIKYYPNALIKVFNRWGALVHENSGGNYENSEWDGTSNGEELPVGTYYYIIDLNNGDEPQTGPITIIR